MSDLKDRVKDYAEELKERAEKVDDRVKVLIKKYPLVFASVLIGGGFIGFLLALWIF